MSGFSGNCTCPNCNSECDQYTDWKPYDYISIQCVECGLMINPQIVYMDLQDLNMERQERGLESLDKLPEQSFKDE